MSCCCLTIIAILAAIAFWLFKVYKSLTKKLPIPTLDNDQYWGPGSKEGYTEITAVEKFDISAEKEQIENLKAALQRKVKFTAPLEGVGFEYGFNSNKLEQVVKFWRDDYLPRWAEREEYLQKYPHFSTNIQGLKIHFIHVKPTKEAAEQKKVLPLILLHGWPGSVREFYDIIPKLITPSDQSEYVFEVVAPSLPGYGWSQGASKKGLDAAQMAVIMNDLMSRLGHGKFLIQGGDFGSIVGSHLATLFPGNAIGYHSNFCLAGGGLVNLKWFLISLWPAMFLKKEQIPFHYPILVKFMKMINETGYVHLQASKPDTIGAALTANPIGLAAYILEKFSGWTNPANQALPDGGLEQRFTLDSLLDNIMIYYLTDSITTSQRLYAEQFTIAELGLKLESVQTSVPTGVARFPHDMNHYFDWQLEEKYTNIVQSNYYTEGGHFAAMEQPEVLYNDFVQFVKKIKI